ncbi:MAG TPA: hypothetical protein VD931_07605 [Baekduia sp.]|nr:hypothetical protein [Baekduia sp.]
MAGVKVLDHELGFTWVADEGMQRASHALVGDDGRVWLIDPVDDQGVIARATARGEVAGVVQLLDRHERDCARIADRLRVPLHRLPDALPGSPFEVLKVVSLPVWQERALWWPARRALVVAEAFGTQRAWGAGQPAGVHVMLRLLPPRGLRAYAPRHLLVGHGAPLHGDGAEAAIPTALARSWRDLPGAVVRLPSLRP